MIIDIARPNLKSPDKMFVVYGEDYCSPLLKLLSENASIYSASEFKNHTPLPHQSIKFCATHEEAVDEIYNSDPDSIYGKAIGLFRNKHLLRKIMQPLYPKFYFETIKLSELQKKAFDFSKNKKYIIKPIKGFFGIAVHVISEETDLKKLQYKIESDMTTQLNFHPNYFEQGALSKEDFIVEEYVGHETSDFNDLKNIEIAIDGYYNSKGEFILISIYHHPYRNDRNYFHMLYYLSENLYRIFSAKVIHFFNELKNVLPFKPYSFPLHAEFKFSDNELFPIEINPGRFGGLGLSDLIYYAFNVNPYALFFNDEEFDWEYHWKQLNDSTCSHYFAWTLSYRSLAAVGENVKFDHQKFQDYLNGSLLHYQKITYDPSVFSIAFTKQNSLENLVKILDINFDKYCNNCFKQKNNFALCL